MEFEYIYPVLILFGSFAVMLAIGVPITFAIGLSSLLSIITALFHPMPPFLLFHKK